MKQFLLQVTLLCAFAFVNAQQPIQVYGTIKNCSRDTIKCVVQENSVLRKTSTYYIPVVNGGFKTSISIAKPKYIYIQEENNVAGGIISPGESIGIDYDSKALNSTLTFSGSAKDKFKWAMDYYAVRLVRQTDPQAKIAKTRANPVEHIFHFFDSAQDYHLRKLQEIKNIDSLSYTMMKGQVIGSVQYYKYYSIMLIDMELTDPLKKLYTFNESYYNSHIYCEQIYNMVQLNMGKMSLKTKYAYLDSLLPQRLKIPLMTMMLRDEVDKKTPPEEIVSMLDAVYASSDAPEYKAHILDQLARQVYFKKGMKAPDFIVENEKGQKLNLASFKGKVVYMDFWFASCAPCHQLFQKIKPVKDHFENNSEVVFLTISVDDKEEWKKALQKFKIAGQHAYTENRERRHAILKDYKIQEYPTTFLIDKNGQIFLAHTSGDPEELKKQIGEALKL